MREHDLALALRGRGGEARQLIEAGVTAEVSAFQDRAEEASLKRVLTEKSWTRTWPGAPSGRRDRATATGAEAGSVHG